jgi:ribosomal-protein-alanine N-acetyltransferase
MDVVTFRRARIDDLSALVSLERQVFPTPWDADTFDATLEDPRCISVLAMEDDGLAGYCLALDLSSMVHILNLAVHPSWRRKGIARRLVREGRSMRPWASRM